jgi:hypothetical protein
MGDNATHHMDAEAIERYSLGDLPERESAPFDEHLLICGVCRTKVEASDAYIAAMRGAAGLVREAERQAVGRQPGVKTRAAGSA